jgi:hypothetical protein
MSLWKAKGVISLKLLSGMYTTGTRTDRTIGKPTMDTIQTFRKLLISKKVTFIFE